MLRGKHILLGVTGSIAAYKAAALIRLLTKEGAEVQVLMTSAAKQFITPLTMATLSKRPILVEFYNPENGHWNNHVSLGEWADYYLIAPATANTIAKMAHGIADNLLLTAYLSARCPVIVAPAMDVDMYHHPANAHNMALLQERGVTMIEPASGSLASGLEGKGRMEEPGEIVQFLQHFISKKKNLSGINVLVTAGPTCEAIDPIRFIGNHSSGKMGYALAEEFAAHGAAVTLVSGPTALKAQHKLITTIPVVSAAQMHAAAVAQFKHARIAVLCAAVADFTPQHPSDKKIKRGNEALQIQLQPTVDIAAELGRKKTKEQIVVGFALETDHELPNAQKKMTEKNLDMIVLNSLNDKGAGFGVDTNKVTLLFRDGAQENLDLKPKRSVAADIVRKIMLMASCLLLFATVYAQELRCNLGVNSSKIQGTNKSIFQTLQKDLNDFLNNRVWTHNKYATDERIECNFFLTITEQPGTNEFKGTLQVQSSRPVYGSSYISPVFNFLDSDISFTYIEYDPIEFNDQTYTSALSSIFAFYVYVILGFDYDTFSLRGGTEYFKKAERIVVNAQGAVEKGWRPYEGSRNNRYWMIENILNYKYDAQRSAYYKYYRLGLDQMSERISEGRASVTEALLDIQKVYRERPDMYLFFLKIFFDAKTDELINIYSEATEQERLRAYQILSEVDKTNEKKYVTLKEKTTPF